MSLQLVTREIQVLSPHLDDAVLSASCALDEYQRSATVINIFDGAMPQTQPSEWDRKTHPRLDSALEVMRARKIEDRNALAIFGAKAVSLGLQEAAYRDHDITPEELAEHLSDRLDPKTPFISPAGYFHWDPRPKHTGAHIDHVITREAAKILKSEGFNLVGFYVELPYGYPRMSGRIPLLQARWANLLQNERAKRIVGLPVQKEICNLLASTARRKMEAVSRYGTQVAVMDEDFDGIYYDQETGKIKASALKQELFLLTS